MYHQSQSPVVILSEAKNLWLFLSQCFHGAPANSQRCFAWLNMTGEAKRRKVLERRTVPRGRSPSHWKQRRVTGKAAHVLRALECAGVGAILLAHDAFELVQ